MAHFAHVKIYCRSNQLEKRLLYNVLGMYNKKYANKVKLVNVISFRFIRIDPHSLGGRIYNLLDCTWVHPESYAIAKKYV